MFFFNLTKMKHPFTKKPKEENILEQQKQAIKDFDDRIKKNNELIFKTNVKDTFILQSD